MLKTLVFEYRIVSYEYFMYDMGISDAELCMEHIKWTDLTLKSLIRYNIWSMYNSNAFGKNKNSIEAIMPLPWDKETNVKHTVLSEKEIKEQEAMMKQFGERIKQGGTKKEKFM